MHHEYRIMWILLHEFVNSSRIMWMLLHESWISIFFVNWGIHIMLAGPRYNIVSILWWHISPPKSLPNLHPKLQSVLFQKEKPIILQIYFSTKKTKILQITFEERPNTRERNLQRASVHSCLGGGNPSDIYLWWILWISICRMRRS